MQTSKVTSIEPVGLKKVFDLEVAGHHNYIANGILVHNCSYHDLLDFYGKKYNDEFYKVKDTFITYKHRRLLFYPAGPNKKTLRGRCLVGSTLVNTEYGFLRLDEIVQHDGQVSVDFVVDSHNGRQQVSHTYRDIANQTYRITTTNGFTLQGTPEHPMYILTPNGSYQWVKMEDLRPGMAIMSMGDTQSPMWSDISEMSESSIDILVANAHALGNYPLEMRCSSKRANQTYIDNLIVKYGDFKDDAVHLDLPKDLKHSLQVILVHGFGVLSKNHENLTIAYDQLAILNAPLSHALAGDRMPVQAADNSLHHEIVQSVVLAVDTTEIFDLTVPQGHAFMANGMVSHNTRVLCIAKGTLVNVSRGLVPIENVVGGDVTYKGSSARKVLSGTFSGNQVVSTITLENGLQIRATKDHLFRVIETGTLQESWVKAVDLKPSMHMLVTLGGDFPEEGSEHVYQNSDGHKYILNSEMARLIAHLSKKTIQGKIKYREETKALVSKMFDAPTKDGDNLILSPTASSVLEAFGYAGNNTGVPDAILTSPKAVARSFLLECFGANLTYTLPIQYVQRVRSLLLKFGILAHSFHSEIRLTTYEYGLLTGNASGKISDKDCSAYAIPYSLHAFRKTYIKSELNDQFLVYDSEKSRHKDRIDAGLAYCRVHSFYSDWDTVPTYDIAVNHSDTTFTANGFVVHNSAIDEIGWFDNQNDGKVKMDATQVYVALDRSLLTVRAAARRLVSQGFDDIPNGFAFNVSSPSSARDKIVELVAQSKSSKKIFGFKCATWEMNPNITKEDLSEEYAKNPVDAERDYACNPPLSDNAFIPSFSSIEGCFIGKPNKVRYKFAQKTMKDGTVTRYAVLDDISKSTKKNVLALDAGYSGNSFGAVCGHLHEGLPIISCFMEVIPNPGIPLNHALIFREAIHEIIRQRNVVLLLADRWQSIKLLQDAELEFENLLAAQYSLRYDDFWIQKQMLFDSEIIFPKLRRSIDDILKFDQSKYPYCFTDPVEHFALQCITVRDMGNSIDKGDGLTDDLFRAASLTTWGLTCDKYQDLFDGDFGEEESMFNGAIGYMAGRSSGVTASTKEVHVSKGKAIGYMSSKR